MNEPKIREIQQVGTIRVTEAGSGVMSILIGVTLPNGHHQQLTQALPLADVTPGTITVSTTARAAISAPPPPPPSLYDQLMTVLGSEKLVRAVMDIVSAVKATQDDDDDEYDHDEYRDDMW